MFKFGNISETKTDISKRKTPFFCILKGLSNEYKFFTAYALYNYNLAPRLRRIKQKK